MTQAEQIFVNRMVPHVMASLSFEDAAKAVIADDERLYLNIDKIAPELTKVVYNELRSK